MKYILSLLCPVEDAELGLGEFQEEWKQLETSHRDRQVEVMIPRRWDRTRTY